MTREQIIAALTALLAAHPNPDFDKLRQGGYDSRYPVTIEHCPRPLPPLDVEARTVVCGHVDVPEDHDASTGKTVPLAFAILKSNSESPAPDPVMYLHGGPGGYAVQDIPFNARVFDFLRGRRDVILFDQRSAGISDKTVACYDSMAAKIKQFAKPGENPISAEGPLATCLKEILASGVDLSLYNTTQSAKDVRAIMHALGYPTYNAYGISYGTKLAQELMRAAPKGLRSVVIDSISRVDNPAYDTNGVPPDQALGAVVDQCAADSACKAAYPNLEATIAAAAARLKSKPVEIADKKVGPELIGKLIERSNKTRGPFTAYLPKIFTELAEGKTTTLEKLLGGGFSAPQTPEALLKPLTVKLDPRDKAIALAIAQQASQLASLQASTGTLLSALSNDTSAAGRAGAEQFLDAALSEAAQGMDPADLLAMTQDYVRFIGKSPDHRDIEAFARAHVPEASLPRILGLISAMSEADVAAFYARARFDSARVTATARMMFSLGIIACQEDFPFNSLAGYDKAAAAYRFPALDAFVRPETVKIYGFCGLFKPHERAGYHEPVKSGIPLLAMAGLKDTQTNPDAADMVVRTLKNSFAFTFPESGHAVILFSQCARDIAASFIDEPTARPNGACIKTLKPRFLLPSGAMSGG